MRRGTRTAIAAAAALALGTLAAGGGAAPRQAFPLNAITLELTPEIARNLTRGTHTINATISVPSPVNQLEVHFKIVEGPNAKKLDGGGVDFLVPDGECIIWANTTTCGNPFTYSDRHSTPDKATDEIVAWIDLDTRSGRDHISLEQLDRKEIADAGAPPHEPGDAGHQNDKGEPDGTDRVVKHWGQPGASRLPFVDGLERAAYACATANGRIGGAVAGQAQRCTSLFRLPARNEEDVERDYYALWIQASATVRRGFCARGLEASLKAPRGTEVLAVASPRAGRSARTRLLATRLVVSGGEFAFVRGVAEQTAFYRPGTLRATRPGGRPTLSWTGKSREPLALALGAELAVPAGTTPKLAGAGTAKLRLARC